MNTTQNIAIVVLIASANACLPKDTRPPPARVLFTATPSPATQSGVSASETADGWAIAFDRVVVSLGRASIDGDSCSSYSEADYSRVLSLVGAPDAQKVSESFALGHCDFGFGVTFPDSDALLGVGTSADDLKLLRMPGTDPYASLSGISLFVSGHADKGDVSKTFTWAFRQRMRYRECSQIVDGSAVRGLVLGQSENASVDVVLHPEALFADSLDVATAQLRFEPMAEADKLGDGDGEVTLDELALVPLEPLAATAAYATGDAGAVLKTLEDFVYVGNAPNVARYRGNGTCTLRLGQMRAD